MFLKKFAVVALALGIALPAGAQDVTLKLAYVDKPTDPRGQGFTRFAELVPEYTDGRVVVETFDSGHLGNNRELFNQLLTGTIDIGNPNFPMLADVVPELSVFLAGYFFDDYNDHKRLWASDEFGGVWKERLLSEANIRAIGHSYQGVRNVTINGKQPRSPADLAGVKLRAVPNPMALSVVSGLGANPTPVPFPELFQALSQGVVDGQENPLPTIWNNKFYEVQDTLVRTDHQLASAAVFINEESWQKISEDDQNAIMRAMSEAMDMAEALALEMESTLAAQLANKGMTVIELSDEERAVFRNAVQASVIEKFDGDIWPEGFAQRVIDFANAE
jgi:tripartite ATP-independent transporter DctP family solute receptor